nr:polysaccharide deacetylase family protein [Candidatus Sigynarchaeota archaeon]
MNTQNGTLCIGYDVEAGDPTTTGLFIDAMVKVHEARGTPCTLFIKGKTLEHSTEHIQKLIGNPLFDLQQHTYSHLVFKRIDCYTGKKHEVYGKDEPLRKIRADVVKASKVLEKRLNITPIGMTTPFAFYKGLTDRPDILKVLHDAGIRFIRSWGRNEQGYNPVPLDVQPFFYNEQGFPDMLECTVNGWQDCIWREHHGWKARWDEQVNSDIDYVAGHGLFLTLCQHDWSSIQQDPEMAMTAAIIDHANAKGVRILHYKAFYEEQLGLKSKVK